MNTLSVARKKPWWQYLATQNPFYLMSACLVLYGLQLSFATEQTLTAGLMLFGILSGYTLLLALSGYVIIRFGQVWDDARMLLLLIVLLLVALSLSFDELVLANQVQGAVLLAAGFCFAVGVSEGVLQALRMRLALCYRLPYYTLLALLFFYPLWLAYLSYSDQDPAMSWYVFLFPAVAGTGFLLLVPAIHLEAFRRPDSGTPWPFPLYPWSLFVVMGVAVALRSYSLSMSYEGMIGLGNTFRGYFLVPLALAGLVLTTEYALLRRRAWLPLVAIVLPLALLPLGLPGLPANRVEASFRQMLLGTVGSPAQWVLGLTTLFFLYTWLRRIRMADVAVGVCLVLAAFVDHTTVDWKTLAPRNPNAIAAAALVMFAAAWLRGSSLRGLAGCGLSVWSLSLRFQQEWFQLLETYFVVNGLLLASLAVLLIANDPTARFFRRKCSALFPLLTATVLILYSRLFAWLPETVHLHVAGSVAMMSLFCWFRFAHIEQLASALASLFVYLIGSLRTLPNLFAQTPLERGGHWIVWGLLVLVVALLWSLAKGGHRLKLRRRLLQLNRSFRSISGIG